MIDCNTRTCHRRNTRFMVELDQCSQYLFPALNIFVKVMSYFEIPPSTKPSRFRVLAETANCRRHFIMASSRIVQPEPGQRQRQMSSECWRCDGAVARLTRALALKLEIDGRVQLCAGEVGDVVTGSGWGAVGDTGSPPRMRSLCLPTADECGAILCDGSVFEVEGGS
ncbi:hypothetical protein J6590_030906 [Homalodisca vitripennis]|nr:hypothetical protein J6590_030906 [Homalodisca vitripennis]